jgi:hypothetical protein
MPNTQVSTGLSKKYILFQKLQEQPKNADGEIVWDKKVLDTLREALGGEANVIQTILYDMEQKGFISRRRRSDGRTVMAISLLAEPPKDIGVRPKMNGTSVHAPGEMYAEVTIITPQMAMAWLDLNTHNRTLRQNFIERLAEAIKRGEWMLNAESIKINPDMLVDGQHRLWAIVLADKPVQALVAYNVPVEAQETIDTGVKRTLSDILKLRGEKENVTLASTLVQLHIWQTKGMLGLQGAYYPTPQQALRLLEQHPEIRESVDVARRLSNRIRFPAGIGAVIHWVVNQIDSEDAADFFKRLTDGTDLDTGNPILALRNTVLEYGPIHTTDRIRIAALGIKAWNFYRGGNEISRLMWKSGGAKPEPFPKPV